MSTMHHPRLLSNKENSILSPTSCLTHPHSSYISKPTLGGLGRSPRKKGHHGSKPYSRSTSVHKAKSPAPVKGVYSSVKVEKKVPTPLKLATPSTSSSRSNRAAVTITNEVRIPLSLPVVNIPLVSHLNEEFDSRIPFEFVRTQLLPRLSGFGIVSAQYRPYPSLSRSDAVNGEQSSRPCLAFGVPSIVEGQDVRGSLAARMKGREPDMCLAITKKGDSTSTLKAPASLVPVNKLVFMSQCLHWDRVTGAGTGIGEASTPGPSVQSPQSHSASAAGTLASEPELQSIKEESDTETDTDEEEEASNTSSPLSDLSSSTVVPSPPSSPTISNKHLPEYHPIPSVLQLPIQPLQLPSTETYSYLHNLLHFTYAPESTFSPLTDLLGMDVSGLHKLDTRELMKKLGVIQGVWKNCCYLGVGDVKIWQGMRDAWGAVVGIVAERGKKVNGMEVDV